MVTLWTQCLTLFTFANQKFVSAVLNTAILKGFYAFVNQFLPLLLSEAIFPIGPQIVQIVSDNILLCPLISSSVLMHFSFLPTFHHRIIALVDGRHPYAQCDQPIGDNFSLPSTGCLVALLSLILLYLKHGTAI